VNDYGSFDRNTGNVFAASSRALRHNSSSNDSTKGLKITLQRRRLDLQFILASEAKTEILAKEKLT